ncbi:MAG: metallopeptidase family protein [Clostridia bacterium]
MVSIDRVEEILNELVDELPKPIFKKLNGGVVLLPDKKYSEVANNNDLIVLGEYYRNNILGRYIKIYYGSMMERFGNLKEEDLRKELDRVLKHELTHHLESLAGERDLEKEDLKFISRYLQRFN